MRVTPTGVQALPGVYLAAQKHLLPDDPSNTHQVHQARHSPSPPRIRAGAIAPTPPSAASTVTDTLGPVSPGYAASTPSSAAATFGGSPKGTPMHGSGAAGQLLQHFPAAPARQGGARDGSPASTMMRGVSAGAESAGSFRSAATDVYGQPRATPLALPAVYSQVRVMVFADVRRGRRYINGAEGRVSASCKGHSSFVRQHNRPNVQH